MIAPLLDHLWQSTAFALVMAGLALLLRNNGAKWRYALWLAASIKFLVPFSLLVGLGVHVSPVVPEIYAPTSLVVAQEAARPFSVSEPILTVHESGVDWIAVLSAAWIAGMVTVLLTWVRHWRRIARALRTATPLVANVPLPVMTSQDLLEPGIVGVWRPVLLLPEGITARLSEREMAAVLAHEISHWKRRDNLTSAMHLLVQCLFWFYPLVWWLGTKLMQERERACDESVLEEGNDPQTYAESILKVCKFYVQSPLACASGISGADLRRRIETIMAFTHVPGLNRAKKILLAATALVAIAVPVTAGVASSSATRIAAAVSMDASDIVERRNEQRRPRTAIAFDPANFDKFVGTYRGDTILKVSRQGNRFYTHRSLGVSATRLTPKPLIEVFPESQSKFFAKDVTAQYSFESDMFGNVTALIFHQSGLERRFPRVTAEVAGAIERAVLERISTNSPSAGTRQALKDYIVAMRQGVPNFQSMAPGIAARTKPNPSPKQIKLAELGILKSLDFQRVDPDGMDIYKATFAKGGLEFWIAPLSADGRTVWVGYKSLQKS